MGIAVLPLSPVTKQAAHDFTILLGEIKVDLVCCSSLCIYVYWYTCMYMDTYILFLQILDIKCLSLEKEPSFIRNLHCTDVTVSKTNTISLTLNWTNSNNPVDPIDHCNLYATCLLGSPEKEGSCWQGQCIYLGSAYANCFRACGLHLLSGDLKEQPFGLKFRVQSVTAARRKPSVEDADRLVVWFCP